LDRGRFIHWRSGLHIGWSGSRGLINWRGSRSIINWRRRRRIVYRSRSFIYRRRSWGVVYRRRGSLVSGEWGLYMCHWGGLIVCRGVREVRGGQDVDLRLWSRSLVVDWLGIVNLGRGIVD